MNHLSFRVKSRNLIILAIIALISSCDKVSIAELKMGKLPDAKQLEETFITVRSLRSLDNAVNISLYVGGKSVIDNILISAHGNSTSAELLEFIIDSELVDSFNAYYGTSYKLLPESFYKFLDGKITDLSPLISRETTSQVEFFVVNSLGNELTPGTYLLPIRPLATTMAVSSAPLYYVINVIEPFEGDADLYTGEDMFQVFYINTSDYDPRLMTEFYMRKYKAKEGNEIWLKAVGNIVNLRTTNVGFNQTTGRVMLQLSQDMKYVLSHYDTYVKPLQDTGRKVCICIEGGGSGMGFCNMSDAQIKDFCQQVRVVFDTYPLDGINLWDRNSGYGKEGLPKMNKISYPKLIKALRELLGLSKLITLTDYEEPTAYFGDTSEMQGIEPGLYLDLAWSGYRNTDEAYQIVDPYHPDAEMISLHNRKPIAGLPKEKYGCINVPWYTNTCPVEIRNKGNEDVLSWAVQGYPSNSIIVYEDLQTNLQNEFEGQGNIISNIVSVLVPDGRRLPFSERYAYDDYLPHLGETTTGYGKWLKDW